MGAKKRGAPNHDRSPNPRQGAQEQHAADAPRSHGELSTGTASCKFGSCDPVWRYLGEAETDDYSSFQNVNVAGPATFYPIHLQLSCLAQRMPLGERIILSDVHSKSQRMNCPLTFLRRVARRWSQSQFARIWQILVISLPWQGDDGLFQ